MRNKFLKDLHERGLIFQSTDLEALEAELEAGEHLGAHYVGFDPTAPSLHIGNFLCIVQMQRAQRCGYKPIALVGGGTALIGDPSFKSEHRTLPERDTVEQWATRIQRQLEPFLDFDCGDNSAVMANNYEWLGSVSAMEILRDVGRHFSVSAMLARDSVSSRLGNEQGGLSFTELSYMILQAYDFLQLYERYGCIMQFGGSDQWGNIVSGVGLIRQFHQQQAHALTFPLIEDNSGNKYGKTEGNAIWLDAELTSPYSFYQFWLNSPDDMVIKLLNMFSHIDIETIAQLETKVETEPHLREAQRTLAFDTTANVHGTEQAEQAVLISQALFSGKTAGLPADALSQLATGLPHKQADSDSINIVDALLATELASSRNDANRLIKSGAIKYREQPVTQADQLLTRSEAVDGRWLLLSRGKKQHALIEFVSSS